MATEELKKEPCEDYISRKTALDAIQELNIPEDMCVFEIKSHIELKIATLPSVIPQSKEAHWVWIRGRYYHQRTLGDWICSGCRYEVADCARKDDVYRMPFYKYCPECGARMKDVYGESEEGAKDE